MRTQRPRARRYEFIASTELTGIETEEKIKARTTNLSLYGCRVLTHNRLPLGTKISIKIFHKTESFAALGRVAYTVQDGEMGISFTRVESHDQLILEKWLAELRNKPSSDWLPRSSV